MYTGQLIFSQVTGDTQQTRDPLDADEQLADLLFDGPFKQADQR